MQRKEVLSLALILTLALSVTSAGAGKEARYQSGGFEYLILENGAVEIHRFSGKEAILTIPDILDGYPVSGIRDFALS